MKKPILAYDGKCGFCLGWVNYWKKISNDAIDYIPYQEIFQNYPHIPKENFAKKIHLIQPDNSYVSGAQAAFKVMATKKRFSFWLFFYKFLPGFSWLSEKMYAWVASHRPLTAKYTKPLFTVSPNLVFLFPLLVGALILFVFILLIRIFYVTIL